REDILLKIEEQGFKIENIVDYTSAEEDDKFLEGTGVLILDHQNRKVYCALSPRADEDLVIEFCEDFEFTPIIFKAYQDVDGKRKQIYHTNVMMGLGEELAVICLDSIDDKKERKMVAESLKEDGKTILDITEEQLHHFAGNMLEVRGAFDKKYWVMSEAAKNSLTEEQINLFEKYSEILSSDLSVIETLGGGSARCMLAEVFLPKK
ncbi:MAG TPA: arginine deiminase-related protein, partial [Flavobacteriaceae bacterium]|nr:arginine deiminase-related protein [Flavobacteriaceae bacterium]